MAARFKTGSAGVATGTVKWFNSAKGYGFIQPDSGGKDVFVHISAVERAGLSSLNEGAKVSYDVVSDRGKESAANLKVKCSLASIGGNQPLAETFFAGLINPDSGTRRVLHHRKASSIA
jgi:CspA family cold shock protein